MPVRYEGNNTRARSSRSRARTPRSACRGCHPIRRRLALASPRRSTRCSASENARSGSASPCCTRRSPLSACAECHEDVHRGQFRTTRRCSANDMRRLPQDVLVLRSAVRPRRAEPLSAHRQAREDRMRRLPQDRARRPGELRPLQAPRARCASCHADIHQEQSWLPRWRPACRCRWEARCSSPRQRATSSAAGGRRSGMRLLPQVRRLQGHRLRSQRSAASPATRSTESTRRSVCGLPPEGHLAGGVTPSATDRCRAPARTATSTSTTVSSGGSSRDAGLETRRMQAFVAGVGSLCARPVVRRWRRRPKCRCAEAQPKGARASGHAAQAVVGGGDVTRCAACHLVEGWDKVRFNHDPTGFPLRGGHMTAACAACHPRDFRGAGRRHLLRLPPRSTRR